MTLVDVSQSALFAGFIIFCRVGTASMFIPAIGDATTTTQVRLVFALLITFLLVPVKQHYIGPVPNDALAIIMLALQEVLVGVVLGMTMKIILSSLHVLGMIIAFNSGLSSGMIFDPSQGTQGSPFGNFLTMFATVMILATDLHLTMISGLANSYDKFAIDLFTTQYDDYFSAVVRTTSDAFNIGIKMAMPFIIVGLVFYLGIGILSRLMPQFQIFFLMLPAQILVNILILMLTASAIISWFIGYYEEAVESFLR